MSNHFSVRVGQSMLCVKWTSYNCYIIKHQGMLLIDINYLGPLKKKKSPDTELVSINKSLFSNFVKTKLGILLNCGF